MGANDRSGGEACSDGKLRPVSTRLRTVEDGFDCKLICCVVNAVHDDVGQVADDPFAVPATTPACPIDEVVEALDVFAENGLVMREDNLYLALAIPERPST